MKQARNPDVEALSIELEKDIAAYFKAGGKIKKHKRKVYTIAEIKEKGLITFKGLKRPRV